MPRTYKPGARPQRTDLNVPGGKPPPAGGGQPNGRPTQPVKVPTGLPYGEAGQLAAAQRGAPLPAAGAVPVPPAGAAPGGGAFDWNGATQAAQGWVPPKLNLAAPTERPTEPVTAGMPTGPGPGPTPPFGGAPSPLAQGVAILNAVVGPVDAHTEQLRQALNATMSNQAAP